jgi:multiple sugar transport system permease protein
MRRRLPSFAGHSQSRFEARAALLFVGLWGIGFSVFLLYPLLASVYYSFCDYSVLRPPVWIGTANYRGLWNDEVFWMTLKNTVTYAAMALPLGIVVAISLALLLNAKVRGMTVFRTIFFLPSLVPMVSLAILWLWIFNGEHGVLNDILKQFHIVGPNWLGDPACSKPSLVLLSLWGTGNAMLIYLAGLQDVPQPLYEAAELDGAGWWARTRHVTLPMLSPVILFNLIMGIIDTLQVFSVPYVMFPGGSPARSTYFYTMYLFDNAFIYHKMGYACAMGWILFLAILSLTLIALKISDRHVHYGGN